MSRSSPCDGNVIVVCPRSSLSATVAAFRPGRMISLRSPGSEMPTDGGLPEHLRLHLVFHDIPKDQAGLVSPSGADVAALLRFAHAWDRAAPLLIHCYAGISRSTAAAFIAAAALEPERDEKELAQTLRGLAPSATPNPFLVRLADAQLGRAGRMSAAVEAIGRGAEAFEGEPFAIALRGPLTR